MRTLYENFSSTEPYAANYDFGAVATVRLPHALFGPTIITHFPLFRKSREKENFGRHRKHFSLFFKQSFNEHFRPPAPELSANSKYAKHLSSHTLDRAIRTIWAASRRALLATESDRPELFIFNAITLINLEINRITHNAIVRRLHRGSAPWDDEHVRQVAFDLTNDVLNIFLHRLKSFLDKFEAIHAARASADALAAPPSAPLFRSAEGSLEGKDEIQVDSSFADVEAEQTRPTGGLGGLISWFEVSDRLEADHNIVGTNLNNLKIFSLAPPTERTGGLAPVLDKYLLWRRGDRNWRYTFYEGSFGYTQPRNSELTTAPSDLDQFLQRLFHSRDISKSFPSPTLDIFSSNPSASEYPFPGTRAAGAQYFLLPAELLLLILANIHFWSSKYLAINARLQALVDAASDRFDKVKDTLTGLESALLQLDPKNEVSTESLAHLLGRRPTEMTDLIWLAGEVRVRIDLMQQALARGVLGKDGSVRPKAQEFYLSFVTMSEALWRVIYLTPEHRLGYDDFVASTVIDCRAIYFSNFRPYERIGFTRTFFIDMNLAPYQRGRLVRRLCEIATYRMSCVTDFNLFQAMQDGINSINNDFNLLVARRLGDPQEVEPLRQALSKAVELYQRAVQFDMFITEGVLGRGRAAEADWDRVKRQVSDIREGRLGGYATLGDFLERGLAVHILEIKRISGRYENLLTRIRDHMSTIRTDLTGTQALKISNFMSHTEKLTNNLSEQAVENVKLSRGLDRQARRQTRLLKGADLLIGVGGTYYLTGLLESLLLTPWEDLITGQAWYAKAGIRLGLLVISLSIVAILYRRLTGQSIWVSFGLKRRINLSLLRSAREARSARKEE
jgi:uncharacterized membrane-anchored protein